MQQCRCEHWQECPVCKPRRFDKDGKRLPPEPTPLQDARSKLEAMESHAKRLALSLECLLLECKDIQAVSKWWDLSHVALTEYQAAIDRLYPQEHVSPLGTGEQQAEPVADGYHTFNELYDFRMSYNAALFNEWAAQDKHFVHKSYRHHTGELCFGGGYFVVVAVLPGGHISNHYKNKYWDLFNIVAVEKALFEFDGHTGTDVLSRLKSYRPQQAEPVTEPVQAEREAIIDIVAMHGGSVEIEAAIRARGKE